MEMLKVINWYRLYDKRITVLSLMYMFATWKQGIHNIIHSRFRNKNNKGQERDRHSGFDNKVCSILVKEAENTAIGGEFVIAKVEGEGW